MGAEAMSDRHFVVTAFAAMLLAVLVIGWQSFSREIRSPVMDEHCYLGIANDLSAHGTFTNGCFKTESEAIAPGRFFGPAYPLFIAALSAADQRLRSTIECHAENPGSRGVGCPKGFHSLIAVQVLLAALGVFFVFLTTREISQSEAVAWLSLVFVLGASEVGYYARTYLTENLSLVSFFAFLYFLMRTVSRGEGWTAAAAGAALALATLSRPAYLYLFPFVAGGVVIALHYQKQRPWREGGRQALILLLVGMLVMSPWALRNLVLFGDPLLTRGYDALSIAFRVSYNAMSWSEWMVSFVFWLPDFGDKLSQAVFAPSLYQRFSTTDSHGFYLLGKQLYKESLVAAGSPELQTSYLVHNYIFADFFKHVLVSLSLALRGMWVGNYLALVGFVLIPPVAIWMWRDGRLWPFLALLLPPLFMVGLHGFVSVNVVRYNVPMLAVFSFTIAVTGVRLVRLVSRWRSHLPAGQPASARRVD